MGLLFVVKFGFRHLNLTTNKRPHPVRLRRANLKARVNAKLALRFETNGLTSFAGLELVGWYFSQLGLRNWIREHLGPLFKHSDFPAVSKLLLLLALLIGGGRRVRHVQYLEDDPVVARFCGLRQLPSARTMGRWLADFDEDRLEGLRAINSRLMAYTLQGSRLKTLTIDVDGSVVSTGLKVQGATRGYNPHRRKVPSYYPISAYAAEPGLMARVENRPGNIHDGAASIGFLTRLFNQLRHETEHGLGLRFRMDAAFFRCDVLDLIDQEQAFFAIKVPFWNHLGLKEQAATRQRWRTFGPEMGCFETIIDIPQWSRRVRVVIYRQRVHHKSAKNYQLDLFDPDDGYYEYSAVATNLDLSGDALWYFMCGRGAHEKAYGELKHGFAFDCVPSMQEHANSAWQLLSVLSFNLMRAFQAATGATTRVPNGKDTTHLRFKHIRKLRFELINRAGRIVKPGGKALLDVGTSHAVKKIFESISSKLGFAA